MKKKNLLFTAIAIFGLATITSAQVPNYVPTTGLVGWWPFNGNANDESGNGNNGTVNGASLTSDRFGVVNKAYAFDGISNFIQLNSILISGNQSRAISFFYKISNNPITDYSAISFGGNSANCSQAGGDYEIGFFNNNGISTRADGTCSAVYASSINDSEWHHVVFNYDLIDGSTFESINIYIDGAYIAAATYNGSTSINTLTLSSLVFGKSNKAVRFFNGKLDDIGIWNRALTACEIQDLYASQLNSTFVSAGIDESICNGDQVTLTASVSQNYTWNNGVVDGTAFSPTNTSDYIVTADSAGCQSADTLTVIVNLPTNSTLNETALDTYTLNGQTYNQSGTFTQIIPNSDGCDSTITLNLTMNYTGISEVGFNLISISPNPTSGIINIQVDDNLIGTKFIIHDHVGTEISLNTFNSKIVEIDLTKLSQGIYFLSTEQKMNKSIRIIKLY